MEETKHAVAGNTAAVTVGVLLVVFAIIIYLFPLPMTKSDFYAYTVPFRIAIAIWAYRIAKKTQRSTAFGPLAFFFPGITLIIVGRGKALD